METKYVKAQIQKIFQTSSNIIIFEYAKDRKILMSIHILNYLYTFKPF